MRSVLPCIVVVLACMSGPLTYADSLFDVAINTSSLVGHPAGPFLLDVQLVDGSGIGDGSNAVALKGFTFGRGSAMGIPTLNGDAFGDLTSSVVLRDTVFVSELSQRFRPGNFLKFDLITTTNPDPIAPDELSISILDSTGTQIPTLGLAPAGSDILIGLDIGTGAAPVAFGSDPSRSPAAGGPPLTIPTPSVQALPEPSAMLLVFFGFSVAAVFRACKLLRGRK